MGLVVEKNYREKRDKRDQETTEESEIRVKKLIKTEEARTEIQRKPRHRESPRKGTSQTKNRNEKHG
jgi:hypothetical protein